MPQVETNIAVLESSRFWSSPGSKRASYCSRNAKISLFILWPWDEMNEARFLKHIKTFLPVSHGGSFVWLRHDVVLNFHRPCLSKKSFNQNRLCFEKHEASIHVASSSLKHQQFFVFSSSSILSLRSLCFWMDQWWYRQWYKIYSHPSCLVIEESILS
jgi:hypothetical protein